MRFRAAFRERAIVVRRQSPCETQGIGDLWRLTHGHDSVLRQTVPCRDRCARSDSHTHPSRHGSSSRKRRNRSAANEKIVRRDTITVLAQLPKSLSLSKERRTLCRCLVDLDQASILKPRASDRRQMSVSRVDALLSAARRLPWFAGKLLFDRRVQVSASAIQRARFAGSRSASCAHSAARERSSD